VTTTPRRERSDSRTPDFPRIPRRQVEAARAGRARARLEAHAHGDHDACPSSLCPLCPDTD
jgi:hypothetical protein